MNKDELAHFGILGMKWGVRRNKSTLSTKARRLSKREKRKQHEQQLKELSRKHGVNPDGVSTFSVVHPKPNSPYTVMGDDKWFIVNYDGSNPKVYDPKKESREIRERIYGKKGAEHMERMAHSNDMYKDELAHYGVLGMKWGVHRSKEVRAAKRARKQRGRELDTILSEKIDRAIRSSGGITDEKFDRINKSYSKLRLKNERINRKELLEAKDAAANRLYSKNSKETNSRINQMSVGKAYLQTWLMGGYGSIKYNQARADGKSRGEALAKASLHQFANFGTVGILGGVDYLKNRHARKKFINQ